MKHNKKRNAAFLFETLSRELTKSIINKKNTLILESKKEVLWIIGIKQSISSYVDKKNKKVLEVGFLKNPI